MTTADTDTTVATHPLADDLVAILRDIGCEPWLVRPDKDDDDAATVLIGTNAARVRGALDNRGLSVRESDVPVREGFDTLLEVCR